MIPHNPYDPLWPILSHVTLYYPYETPLWPLWLLIPLQLTITYFNPVTPTTPLQLPWPNDHLWLPYVHLYNLLWAPHDQSMTLHCSQWPPLTLLWSLMAYSYWLRLPTTVNQFIQKPKLRKILIFPPPSLWCLLGRMHLLGAPDMFVEDAYPSTDFLVDVAFVQWPLSTEKIQKSTPLIE